MALKKSELYSSLWQSCDELRGGMDASQYKDYVLVLLFIRYISDKYAGVPYERFKPFGVPPAKQGDYAYLLHIVRALKSTGKGACILPHGVLFRGNAEADIRRALVRKGYIQGIIGLPANLFYGTGIPACIIVVDKAHAPTRQGIFMIDASRGYMKDGPKSRLRAQDIHKIVDVFTRQLDIPHYSRMVSFEEIEKNEFNLNLPRYIDSQTPEDIQDIAADGWKAETYRIIEKDKRGKERDKGWACDLVPKALIVARYFAAEQEAIAKLESELESSTACMSELEEEHGGEEGVFSALDKVNKANVTARLKEIRGLFATDDEDTREETAVLDGGWH